MSGLLPPRAAWILLALCLQVSSAGCRSTPPATPTATPAPPTATQLPVPDLAPVFDDRRLLPPNASAVEISLIEHPSFEELPESRHFLSVIYSNGAEFAGRVSLFVYAQPEDLDYAWPRLLDLIVTPNEVQGIGELAAVDHSDMAFIRCMTLVHIKLVNSDPFELRTYAETLDAKLIPVVCP